MAEKISLNQQVDEIMRVIHESQSSYGRLVASGKLRQSLADFQMRRQEAACETLMWLRSFEVEIKAFLALSAEDRAVVISHGHLVAQLAGELARREAIAKAGGPLR